MPELNDRQPYYTVAQVAELLSVHPGTVRRFVREGRLIGYRLGDGQRGRWRIDTAAVDAMLGASRTGPGAVPDL